MKTDHTPIPGAAAPAVGAEIAPSAFTALLYKPQQAVPGEGAYPRADGIALGTLASVGGDGQGPCVDIPALGLAGLPARSMVTLQAADAGRSVAIGFEGARADRPIILGMLMPEAMPAQTAPPSAQAASKAVEVSRDGQRVRIEAETELELRCGDAAILLTADGHVHIRGAYVTSHASAGQRIRGGSVQIN
ncbi:DUF6484 domain-containing protein [Paracidovorax oryzae]|uniref:DUF6484 domain-containing protein n=1 Tax=Paracidovorax oryzae TaxID=862720 RepID=UPI000A687EF0|nr:DUF6484 domain-containing protein [Paracidovorax oryzae]